MPKKKKIVDVADLLPEEPITKADVNVNELFVKLKEFENKVLLDRFKLLERNISLIQKAQMIDHTLLKEINHRLTELGFAYEELLSHITVDAPSYQGQEDKDSEESSEVTTKSEKKWN